MRTCKESRIVQKVLFQWVAILWVFTVEVQALPVVQQQVPFLFGGEVQYFRIRDPNFNGPLTKAMWLDRLQALKQAGCNFVSTYVPWDYHELEEGVFSFKGARDVGWFLEQCYQLGLYVCIKPGPYITAEWPTGFGSFGAVPQWLKTNYPQTLARKPDGTPWSFDLFGGASGYQCSFMHPDFLLRVQRWFDAITPLLKTYIFDKPCIIMLQIDNETNLFWGDHYQVDYSTTAVNYYRDFLRSKYSTIQALNTAYGTNYSSFSAVTPPTAAPTTTDSRAQNALHIDWFEAAQEMIKDYQALLKGYWQARGITENDVLFTTNDSPFGISTPLGLADRLIIMADGNRKNSSGLHCLDTYPRQDPTSSEVLDYPFQPDWSIQLYAWWNKHAGYTSFFPHAIEIQGGFYTFPGGSTPTVTPAATEMTLCKLIGSGMHGGSVYVFAGGINIDGSDYDFQAAVSVDGARRERYYTISRFGNNLITPWGDSLRASLPVGESIAIAANSQFNTPLGGIEDQTQPLMSNEYAGIMGWFQTAGYQPTALDLHTASLSELMNYAVLVYLNTDVIDTQDAQKLLDYVNRGGILLMFCWAGSTDLVGVAHNEHQRLQNELLGATDDGFYRWPFSPYTGEANVEFGSENTTVVSAWYETFWQPPPDATVFLWERNFFGGTNGRPMGFFRNYGQGHLIFIGTHLGTVFNRAEYFDFTQAYPWSDLNVKVRLLRWLLTQYGIFPTVTTDDARHLAKLRYNPQMGDYFLFVENDGSSATFSINPESSLLETMPEVVDYQVTSLLKGTAPYSITGRDFKNGALQVTLDQYQCDVIHLTSLNQVPTIRPSSLALLCIVLSCFLLSSARLMHREHSS